MAAHSDSRRIDVDEMVPRIVEDVAEKTGGACASDDEDEDMDGDEDEDEDGKTRAEEESDAAMIAVEVAE